MTTFMHAHGLVLVRQTPLNLNIAESQLNVVFSTPQEAEDDGADRTKAWYVRSGRGIHRYFRVF